MKGLMRESYQTFEIDQNLSCFGSFFVVRIYSVDEATRNDNESHLRNKYLQFQKGRELELVLMFD